jgi:hypothetical protein
MAGHQGHRKESRANTARLHIEIRVYVQPPTLRRGPLPARRQPYPARSWHAATVATADMEKQAAVLDAGRTNVGEWSAREPSAFHPLRLEPTLPKPPLELGADPQRSPGRKDSQRKRGSCCDGEYHEPGVEHRSDAFEPLSPSNATHGRGREPLIADLDRQPECPGRSAGAVRAFGIGWGVSYVERSGL